MSKLMPVVLRVGTYGLSVGKCPGQKRFATKQNGDRGRTFWTPGLSINVWWNDLL